MNLPPSQQLSCLGGFMTIIVWTLNVFQRSSYRGLGPWHAGLLGLVGGLQVKVGVMSLKVIVEPWLLPCFFLCFLTLKWGILLLCLLPPWHTPSLRWGQLITGWNHQNHESQGTFSLYNLVTSDVCYRDTRLADMWALLDVFGLLACLPALSQSLKLSQKKVIKSIHLFCPCFCGL